LLPKDNENVPLPIWPTDAPEDSAAAPFAPDQMVRCEECLRANPPTRVNCLYCAAVLPNNETTVNLQKPALRPLEKWEQGYNNILLPPVANLTDADLATASDLLRLRPEDLGRILSAARPLPLARAATIDEAQLIQRRLSGLGLDSIIMPDGEPGIDAPSLVKVRALDIAEAGIYAYQTPETPFIQVSWPDLALLVVGRLIVKRVELKERKGARTENSILDSSEFVTDETVVDFYIRNETRPYRIAANSFDFSCLGASKGLLAGENISRLLQLFREHAPAAEYDDSFNSMRKTLEPVWPAEQQNESSGWRRERPGKYSIGSVMELNNEMQFSRYSRLRHFLQTAAPSSAPAVTRPEDPEKTDDDA
jgi:hypothetical protein